MSELQALLFLFAGFLFVNALVSAVLWRTRRTALHRAAFLFWLWWGVSLTAQALVQRPEWMPFAFGVCSFAGALVLGDLLRRALGFELPWNGLIGSFAVALLASAGLALLRFPFAVVAAPMAVGASLPLFAAGVQAVRGSPRPLTGIGKLAVLSAVCLGLHELDYPFLRMNPSAALLGFTVAILCGLAIATTVPAVILEASAAEVSRLQVEAIANERLSALGQAAAVVAHEVRNPLGAITNIIGLLQRDVRLSDHGRELLAMQQSEADRLDRLVEDLLCFTRPLSPRSAEVNLRDLVLRSVETVRPLALKSQLRLELSLESAPPVWGDADHILLALTNVLRNAIEASPEEATVRISLAGEAERARVRIDDEGQGIASHAQAKMFEPFFTTRATGSGLGLAIVRHVMEAHRGTVRAENLPSGGARFELLFRTREGSLSRPGLTRRLFE